MDIHIIGMVDNEDDAKEIKFMAKLMVVGLRAQKLGKEAQNGRV